MHLDSKRPPCFSVKVLSLKGLSSIYLVSTLSLLCLYFVSILSLLSCL